jgi:hypothetical protein
MNARIPSRRLLMTLMGATALSLVACSERTGPQQPALTAAQADSVAEVVVADAQAELDAATAGGGVGFVPGQSPPSLALPLSPPLGCQPTITPAVPGNSDADRVPDSVRLTFADCVLTLRRGSDTVRGTIDVVDPTPTVTDRAIRLVFTDLARILVDRRGRVSSITMNGSRQVIRDSARIAQSAVDFQTDYVFRDSSVASHVRNWDLLFTADSAGAIRVDAWLPSGTLTVTGNSTFTHGDRNFGLQVTTPTPLHFNATCEDRPKFDAGTLVVVATRNFATTTVTITFTGCGQYTLTKT